MRKYLDVKYIEILKSDQNVYKLFFFKVVRGEENIKVQG